MSSHGPQVSPLEHIVNPLYPQVLNLQIQPTTDQKQFLKVCCCCHVMPMMVISVLSMYKLFYCRYPLNNIV